MLLERVIAHYQPIVEIGTGKSRVRNAGQDRGRRRPGAFDRTLIEAIESDPEHLERLMWRLRPRSGATSAAVRAFSRFLRQRQRAAGDDRRREDPRDAQRARTGALPRPAGVRSHRATGTERHGSRRAGSRPQGPRPDRDGRLRHREQRPAQLLGHDVRRAQDRSLAGRAFAERPDCRPPGSRHRRAGERAAGAHRRGRWRPPRRRSSCTRPASTTARAGSGARRCRPKSCRGRSKAASATGSASCLRCCTPREGALKPIEPAPGLPVPSSRARCACMGCPARGLPLPRVERRSRAASPGSGLGASRARAAGTP